MNHLKIYKSINNRFIIRIKLLVNKEKEQNKLTHVSLRQTKYVNL